MPRENLVRDSIVAGVGAFIIGQFVISTVDPPNISLQDPYLVMQLLAFSILLGTLPIVVKKANTSRGVFFSIVISIVGGLSLLSYLINYQPSIVQMAVIFTYFISSVITYIIFNSKEISDTIPFYGIFFLISFNLSFIVTILIGMVYADHMAIDVWVSIGTIVIIFILFINSIYIEFIKIR